MSVRNADISFIRRTCVGPFTLLPLSLASVTYSPFVHSGESRVSTISVNFVTGPADCVHGSCLDPTGETGKTGETSAGGFWPVIVTAGPFLHRRSQHRGRRVNRVSFRRSPQRGKSLEGFPRWEETDPSGPADPGPVQDATFPCFAKGRMMRGHRPGRPLSSGSALRWSAHGLLCCSRACRRFKVLSAGRWLRPRQTLSQAARLPQPALTKAGTGIERPRPLAAAGRVAFVNFGYPERQPYHSGLRATLRLIATQ